MIEVTMKSVYGQDLIYVLDPDVHKNIQTLTGRKTLTKSDIAALKNLGFEFCLWNCKPPNHLNPTL